MNTQSSPHDPIGWHGTTILCVRRDGRVAMAGDGQVSLGQTVVKGNARKVRSIANGKVLAGFAGATADAFTLLERLEAQAGVRAGDQAELQKRNAETDGAIGHIEETLERLQAENADPALERRLDSIERALGSLVSRLETYDPAAPLEDAMRGIRQYSRRA